MRHERTINEYRNVKYQPRDTPDRHTWEAFNFVGRDEGPLVYVEGYVKFKPSNTKFRHSWAFDPANGTGFELGFDRGEMLNDLKIGESVPWSRVEYHGYEISKEEMKKTERPPVLSDSDLNPILKKLTSLA